MVTRGLYDDESAAESLEVTAMSLMFETRRKIGRARPKTAMLA